MLVAGGAGQVCCEKSRVVRAVAGDGDAILGKIQSVAGSSRDDLLLVRGGGSERVRQGSMKNQVAG